MGIIRKENTVPPTPPSKPTTAAEMRELTNQYINNHREEVIAKIRDSASKGNFNYCFDYTTPSLVEYLVSLGYEVEVKESNNNYMKVSWKG